MCISWLLTSIHLFLKGGYMVETPHPNVGSHPWIFEDSNTYKHKFNAIYKQYKDGKIVNEVSGNDCHECPFYDALDNLWHQNETVMKHVNAFVNETKK
jgi:hypothetical protein